MKFFIAEGNIGNHTTKDTAEKVIELLKQRGWDVEYGFGRNLAVDENDVGREEALQDAFSLDFMECIAIVENQNENSDPV